MIIILGIIAAVLVLAVGLLIFWLQRKSQEVVPDVADRTFAPSDQVVGVDETGGEVLESDEEPEEPRNTAPFEELLHDEIHEHGMREPTEDDQS